MGTPSLYIGGSTMSLSRLEQICGMASLRSLSIPYPYPYPHPHTPQIVLASPSDIRLLVISSGGWSLTGRDISWISQYFPKLERLDMQTRHAISNIGSELPLSLRSLALGSISSGAVSIGRRAIPERRPEFARLSLLTELHFGPTTELSFALKDIPGSLRTLVLDYIFLSIPGMTLLRGLVGLTSLTITKPFFPSRFGRKTADIGDMEHHLLYQISHLVNLNRLKITGIDHTGVLYRGGIKSPTFDLGQLSSLTSLVELELQVNEEYYDVIMPSSLSRCHLVSDPGAVVYSPRVNPTKQ